MRPIPKKLREQLQEDPFMQHCIHEGCPRTPEWEHAWIYSGRQINEDWAIVPCCTFHHRGKGLDKNYNQYIALSRSNILEVQKKYPKRNWAQLYTWLRNMYDSNA